MIIDVPVKNEDGSLKFTQTLNAEQAQVLLQFALNFLTSAGLQYMQGVSIQHVDSAEELEELSSEKPTNLN